MPIKTIKKTVVVEEQVIVGPCWVPVFYSRVTNEYRFNHWGTYKGGHGDLTESGPNAFSYREDALKLLPGNPDSNGSFMVFIPEDVRPEDILVAMNSVLPLR